MKKIVLTLAVSLLVSSVFAKEKIEKESKKQSDPVTKCCTRTANNGQQGAGYLSVTVTRCSTSSSGSVHNAIAHACSSAEASAKAAVKTLEDSIYVISNE